MIHLPFDRANGDGARRRFVTALALPLPPKTGNHRRIVTVVAPASPPPNMNPLSRLLPAALLAALPHTAAAIEMFWEPLPGKAKDIGVGADGSVWIVGSGITNGDVYQWNGSNWKLIGGSGVLIAVGPAGDPWVVDMGANLYHRINNQWVLITQTGSATGIGVGADGTVLVPGGKSCFCGPVFDQSLFQYSPVTGFTELPGGGHGAVIEPDGRGWWVLDSNGRIFRWQGGPEYEQIPGHARDLSRSANGDIWIIGGGAFETGNDRIFRWNGVQFEEASTGQARQISVAPDGTPWVVNGSGSIFRGHRLGLRAQDVTVTEGADLQFQVTLSYPSDRLASVAYQVLKPDQSVASSGTLSFPPGTTNRVVTQFTTADPQSNGNRIYRLQLANAVGADLVQPTGLGTVVDDAAAAPPVLVPFRSANGGFGVRLASVAGRRYQLQRRTTVGPEIWSPLVSLNGTGATIELGDSGSPADQAYYRVAVTAVP